MDLSLGAIAAAGYSKDALACLQLNLWNGWLDKFRCADAAATDKALGSLSKFMQIFFNVQLIRTARMMNVRS